MYRLGQCPRVRVKERHPVEAEPSGRELDKPLSNPGDPDPGVTFPLERGHWQRVAVTVDVVERFQVRVDVQHDAEATHPVPNGHPEVGHAPAVDAHARLVEVGLALKVIFTKEVNEK